jgi:hypothetical protein
VSLRTCYVKLPRSRTIAAALNVAEAKLCEHDRNPCISRCGVRRILGVWARIPKPERDRWLRRVLLNCPRGLKCTGAPHYLEVYPGKRVGQRKWQRSVRHRHYLRFWKPILDAPWNRRASAIVRQRWLDGANA